MRRRNVGVVSAVLLSVTVVWAFAAPEMARGQEPVVVERLFRSVLTSVEPVYAPGEEGNADAVIGLDTESTLYEINEPIEKGLIPRPRQSDAEPIARMFGQLRCMGRARLDKSKPLQILVGRAKCVGRTMRFEAKGTAIVHWGKDENGNYNGTRWTDFSGAMTGVEGRLEGTRGHVVGTRLLIGDPNLEAQSGLIIARLRK